LAPPLQTIRAFSRPLCPYPQWAQYKGGDPNDWNSFQCGGNLEDDTVALCHMPRLRSGSEHGADVDFLGISPELCAGASGKLEK